VIPATLRAVELQTLAPRGKDRLPPIIRAIVTRIRFTFGFCRSGRHFYASGRRDRVARALSRTNRVLCCNGFRPVTVFLPVQLFSAKAASSLENALQGLRTVSSADPLFPWECRTQPLQPPSGLIS
jgi:hypothetical protein